MPLIMPIKDLRNTTEISNIAHKEQEPIFITKNGYSDLVVMSSELYDKFARINRIDQVIFESEQEIANGAEAVDAEIVFAELEKNINPTKSEGRYAGKDYRQLLIDNYIAIFRIDEPHKTVYVVTIQYQGRNL